VRPLPDDRTGRRATCEEMTGRIRVAKLNLDENPVTGERFHIRSIPALLILKSGQEIDRFVGAQPKSEIVRRLEKTIQQYQSTNR